MNELALLADTVEAAAYRDMFAAAPVELAQALSMRAEQLDGVTLLIARGIPDPVFVRAIGMGNDGRADATLIDAVTAVFNDAKTGSYLVHVNPSLAPRELAPLLEARGFTLAKRRTWAKMVRGAAPLSPCDTTLTVREANPNERTATSQAIAGAFGMPPPFAAWVQKLAERSAWTMMTALDGDRVVGGGLLYIDRGVDEDPVSWLGLGGVALDARRHHAHRAIMAARIEHALAHGCKHIVTETGEPIGNEPNPSLRNMYRLGFERVASRLNYVSPPQS